MTTLERQIAALELRKAELALAAMKQTLGYDTYRTLQGTWAGLEEAKLLLLSQVRDDKEADES